MSAAASTGIASNVDAHVEMDPDDAIAFSLSTGEATPRVTLTLRHPDPDSNPVAFKVRTERACRLCVCECACVRACMFVFYSLHHDDSFPSDA